MEQVGVEDGGAVGGKAANLGRMLRAGLRVPWGFCVTVGAYEELIGGSKEGAAIREVESASVERVREVSARLRERIVRMAVPGEIEREVRKALGGREGGIWAVRSSAVGEDSAGASFAGQHDTFLNVRGVEEVLGAIRGCWGSLFTERAVVYRRKKGIVEGAAGMGVIVQEMVAAEVAGVMFTAEPMTGRGDRIVIEGARGLGEGVVTGRADIERVTLDKKTLGVVEGRGGKWVGDELARRIGELGKRVEGLFGGPQDVEWAVEGGRIWVLQSRPITAMATKAAEEPEVWSNANSGEVLPDVATPMTWDVVQVLMKRLLDVVLRRLGIDPEERPWFGLIAGRVYMNVSTTVRVLGSLPGPGVMDMTEAFGGEQGREAAAIVQEMLKRQRRVNWRTARRLPWLAAEVLWYSGERRAAYFFGEWKRRADEVAALEMGTMSDQRLGGLTMEVFERASRGAEEARFAAAAIASMGMGMGCALGVFRLTKRWLGDEDGSVANRLISCAGGMASADSAMELWGVAAWVREHDEVRRVVMEGGRFEEVKAKLGGTEEGREFLKRWDGFMAEHGHHTRGEMDVHNPRWSETPDYVLGMMRTYLEMGEEGDALRMQARRMREREELLADCRRRLRNPVKRWVLGFAVRRAQRGLSLRECVKSEAVRMVAALRRAMLEAGRRLVERGIAQEVEDVFFLKLGELGPVLSGGAGSDVKERIGVRRAEYERNLKMTPPPVIVGEFDPASAVSGAVEEGAEVMRGLAVSAGVATGRARVILKADEEQRVLPGEILVAPFTDPGWAPYFLTAAGIVMDMGGQLSHGSIVAREYGIPAVVNVGPATRIIRTGQMVRVDGNRGIVTIMSAHHDIERETDGGAGASGGRSGAD